MQCGCFAAKVTNNIVGLGLSTLNIDRKCLKLTKKILAYVLFANTFNVSSAKEPSVSG
jgi:hypothetical protein